MNAKLLYHTNSILHTTLPARLSPLSHYNGSLSSSATSTGVRPLPASKGTLRCLAVRLLTMHRRGRALRGSPEPVDARGHAAKCCPVSRNSNCRKRTREGVVGSSSRITKVSYGDFYSKDSIVRLCIACGQYTPGRHNAVVSWSISGRSAGTVCCGRYTTTVRPRGLGEQWSLAALADIRGRITKHDTTTAAHQPQCFQYLTTEPR